MTDWQTGSPQGSPTPSFEGALGKAVSFRAGSLGFGDTLPLAEGGGKCEPASEKPLQWGRGWGEDWGERMPGCPRGPAQLLQAH